MACFLRCLPLSCPRGDAADFARRRRMHTVSEIEEKIRRRYHQPKGVEQFGIEPVPSELKTVRWLDIFAIIFGFALNPGSILVGGLAVVSGLSFLGAVGAITGGVLLATI